MTDATLNVQAFALIPGLQTVEDVEKHIKTFDRSVTDRGTWSTAIAGRLVDLQSGFDETQERLNHNWALIELALAAGLGIMPQTHKARVWEDNGVLRFKGAGTPSVTVGTNNEFRLTTREQAFAHWTKNQHDEISLCFNNTPLLPLDADQQRKGKGNGIVGLKALVGAEVLSSYPQQETQNGGRHILGRMEADAAWIAKAGNLPSGVDVKASGGFLRCGKRGNGKFYAPAADSADMWEAIRLEGARRRGEIGGEPWSHVPLWPSAVLDAMDAEKMRFKPLAEQTSAAIEGTIAGHSEGYVPLPLSAVLAGPFATAIRAEYSGGLHAFLGRDESESGVFFKWFGAALNVLGLMTRTKPDELDHDEFLNVFEWASDLTDHKEGIAEYAERYGTRQALRCGTKNAAKLIDHGYYPPKGSRKTDFQLFTVPPPPPPPPPRVDPLAAERLAFVTMRATYEEQGMLPPPFPLHLLPPVAALGDVLTAYHAGVAAAAHEQAARRVALEAALVALKVEHEAAQAAAVTKAIADYDAAIAPYRQGRQRLENPRELLVLLAATRPADKLSIKDALDEMVKLSHGGLPIRPLSQMYKDAEKPHDDTAYKAARRELLEAIHGVVEAADGTTAKELTEDWLALAFATRHQSNLKFVPAWGWLRWNGTMWERDEGIKALDDMRTLCRTIPERFPESEGVGSASMINAALKLATSDPRVAATAKQWDNDDWVLNTPGGVVDLRTGRLLAPDPARLMLKSTAVAPATGGCPVFMRFLNQALNGDQEVIAYLQKWCGYTLTGSVKEQIFTFFIGAGGTGKGTFLGMILKILNSYAISVPAEVFEEKKRDRHPTEIARMAGARFAVAAEFDPSHYWSEMQFKHVSGGDMMSGRFMHKDFFDFMPKFNPAASGNSAPKLARIDTAIARRIIMISFNVMAKDQPGGVDVNLSQKLAAEWPQILNWMVDGCLAWQRDGLNPPASMLALGKTYAEDHDPLTVFLDECCVVDQGTPVRPSRVTLAELFRQFRMFASDGNFRAGIRSTFKDDLVSRGLEARKFNDGVNIIGLRLKNPADRTFGVVDGGISPGNAGPAPIYNLKSPNATPDRKIH